jgi:general secretion pathway protein G
MAEHRHRRVTGGFTLLEIMIVLAIIGLIVAAVGRTVYKNWQDARLKIARIQVRDVLHTVEQYVVARDTCPTLEQLVSEEYLRQLPKDPWGSPLVLRCPGQHKKDAADVVSLGPDREVGTADDIVSWE